MTIKNNLKYKKEKNLFQGFSFIKISSKSSLDHQQSNMVLGDGVKTCIQGTSIIVLESRFRQQA